MEHGRPVCGAYARVSDGKARERACVCDSLLGCLCFIIIGADLAQCTRSPRCEQPPPVFPVYLTPEFMFVALFSSEWSLPHIPFKSSEKTSSSPRNTPDSFPWGPWRDHSKLTIVSVFIFCVPSCWVILFVCGARRMRVGEDAFFNFLKNSIFEFSECSCWIGLSSVSLHSVLHPITRLLLGETT